MLVIKSLESLAEPLFTFEQCLDMLAVACADATMDVKYAQIRMVLDAMPAAKRGELGLVTWQGAL